MLKKFFKGLGIGLGIGLAFYATGLAKDCKEKNEITKERDTFGTWKSVTACSSMQNGLSGLHINNYKWKRRSN